MNIITNLYTRNYTTALYNPEERPYHLSPRKEAALNTEIIRERNEMIAHPSYLEIYQANLAKMCQTGSKETLTNTIKEINTMILRERMRAVRLIM